MKPAFKPHDWEDTLYTFWEKKNYLKPTSGKPYTILMPPPNANASLHAGHGMYTVDDVMIRWKRMNGWASLWIPGMDHAGFETQYVYEKHLQKQGKSRMDFDRKTLYKNIYEFVEQNSGQIYDQFKKLGFLADWDRSVFTLDEHVVERVYETFRRMVNEGLVYRDEYIVNYCIKDGTSLADLEVVYADKKDSLYYVKYLLADGQKIDGKDHITVATVRPETIPLDTHLAVNPRDERNKSLIGVSVENPLTRERMTIIADDFVDPEFGSGIVKLTPAHDHNDFEVSKRQNIPVICGIELNGRMNSNSKLFEGMKIPAAREAAVTLLKENEALDHVNENYDHRVPTCYKCGRNVESLTIPNWFIKVDKLKAEVRKVVKDEKVTFNPPKFKKQMLDWLDVMHDWPISRQIVWGIRIPVWYNLKGHESRSWLSFIDSKGEQHIGSLGQLLREGHSLDDIKVGLQQLRIPIFEKPENQPPCEISKEMPTQDGEWFPETDTFDTWFSSGQWPLVTLGDGESEGRFPTDFMGTLSDILKFWISRMLMFSLYVKNEIPFKNVYLWSLVADAKGKKMSKSKGNVINPIDLVEKYGADAFRATLFFGLSQTATVNLSEDKVRAMRNFSNKIWNIGRFIYLGKNNELKTDSSPDDLGNNEAIDDESTVSLKDARNVLRELQSEFAKVEKKAAKDIESYSFSIAFNDLYEFLWHRFADHYIEVLKDAVKSGNIEILEGLEDVYMGTLKLLHPYMPFVTEAVWKSFYGNDTSILDSRLKEDLI